MKHNFFNKRMRVGCGRACEDPGKSVLPLILFINTNHDSFGDLRRLGFVVFVGWWDFYVEFGWVF